MGERATGEWDAANRAPGLERSYLGDDPALAKVGHQQVEAAKLQIPAGQRHRRTFNIALRHASRRLLLRRSDRVLMVWMTRLWPNLLGLARVVQPATGQQIVEAFPWNAAAAYLVRDNDGCACRKSNTAVETARQSRMLAR